MANRAYLFSTNVENYNEIRDVEKPYFDSRWNIPILWFLLFSKSSIKTKTVYFEDDFEKVEDSWEEVILIEEKKTAMDNFLGNLSIVEPIWNGIESDDEVLRFIEKIKSWNGKFLVVDVSEIVQDNMNKAHQDFYLALSFLETKIPAKFAEALNNYSGEFTKPDFMQRLLGPTKENISESLNYFIGYTYW